MEDSKLLALHDDLSKYQNKKKSGLGVSNAYNFAGSKNKQSSDSTATTVREDGLPNNSLYVNFLRQGTYDPTKDDTTANIYGDGRVIKRNFDDCITEISVSSNSDDDENSVGKKKKITKEERKEQKKEEKKAKKKAAKLEAKKQAKIEAKLAARKQRANAKGDEIPSATTNNDDTADEKIDSSSSASKKKSKKRKKSNDDEKDCESSTSGAKKKSKCADDETLEIKISNTDKESGNSKKKKKKKRKSVK